MGLEPARPFRDRGGRTDGRPVIITVVVIVVVLSLISE